MLGNRPSPHKHDKHQTSQPPELTELKIDQEITLCTVGNNKKPGWSFLNNQPESWIRKELRHDTFWLDTDIRTQIELGEFLIFSYLVFFFVGFKIIILTENADRWLQNLGFTGRDWETEFNDFRKDIINNGWSNRPKRWPRYASRFCPPDLRPYYAEVFRYTDR